MVKVYEVGDPDILITISLDPRKTPYDFKWGGDFHIK